MRCASRSFCTIPAKENGRSRKLAIELECVPPCDNYRYRKIGRLPFPKMVQCASRFFAKENSRSSKLANRIEFECVRRCKLAQHGE